MERNTPCVAVLWLLRRGSFVRRTAKEIKYEEVAERRKVFGNRISVKVGTAYGIRTAE